MNTRKSGVARGIARSLAVLLLVLMATVLLKTTAKAQKSDLADVSGTVTAPKPFKAAQVYFRNTDKRMLYMVYTSGGHYSAVDLFPGNYEFSVKAEGLSSEAKKIVLKAGKNGAEDIKLQDAAENPDAAQPTSFNEVYPPGRERDMVQGTCMGCHGPSFIPAHQWDESQWNAAIDLMTKMGNVNFNDSDRKMLVAWLAKNFGPDSKPRTVIFDIQTPIEEAKLSKAMYIEYYLQPHPAGQDTSSSFGGGRVMGQDPHFDKEGFVWFTDRGTPPRLCKLDPRTGAIQTWNMPGKGSIHGLTIDGDGIVWVAETDGGHHLNAFDPKTGKFERWDFDPDGSLTKENGRGLSGHTPVLDSHQNVWISMISGDRLIKWDRHTQELKIYDVPSKPSGPYGIDIDQNDNIWIAESRGPARVAKFDPTTEKWTEYDALTQPGRIRRLSVDSKGNVWYGLFSGGKIGKVDPSGKVTEYQLPTQFAQPYDIWPDNRGNIWFSDGGQGGALVKYQPDSGSFSYYPSPQVTDQPKIEITRDGAIWYCPRSAKEAGVGVLYPDMTKINTLMAFYPEKGATITKSTLSGMK